MHCPRDGLRYVTEADHKKAPRDMFLGTTVGGKYPILAVVGHGGMGAVYRSVQPLVDRDVAVKMVLPAADAQVVDEQSSAGRRFRREAKAIASLSHPGIVTLFDFGIEESGTAYMVMELVRGETMSRPLRTGQLDRQTLIDVILEILEALSAAHGQGLVHRDLKPENAMLLDTPSGRHRVKILDFGLAKLSESVSSGSSLTGSGAVFGTPQYMAPEQAQSEEVGPAADLYAVGVMLYEGLAGRLPFEGDHPLALLSAHVNEPAPDLPADVPPALAAVVKRAMAKAPEDRYEDAAAMAEALRSASQDAGLRVADWQPAAATGASATPVPVIDTDAPTLAASVAPVADAQALADTVGHADELRPVAGATPPPAPKRTWVVAAVAVAALGGVAIWASGPASTEGRDTSSTKSAQAGAPQVTPLRIKSNPTGAQVFLGEEAQGVTPLALMAKGEAGSKRSYRLEAAKHAPAEVEVVLDGIFRNVRSEPYWSNTEEAVREGEYWNVLMTIGDATPANSDRPGRALCVRTP